MQFAMESSQAATQGSSLLLPFGEQPFLMPPCCGHSQPVPDYWQPMTIDPALTLLSTTPRTFEGTQGVSTPPINKRSMADTADLFTECWEPSLQEWLCEDCPLQEGSRSVIDCSLQVESETAIVPLGQVTASCGMLPEQQPGGLYNPILDGKAEHSMPQAEAMYWRRGLTGTIANYTTSRSEVGVPSVSMARGSFLRSSSEDPANSPQQRQFGGRASTSDGIQADGPKGNSFKERDACHAIWELVQKKDRRRGQQLW